MKLTERGSVAEHMNNFTQVTSQLESAGVKLEEKLQALLFLCSLPDSYNTAVQAISGTMKDTITLNDAVSSIMNEEMRRRASGGEASSSGHSSALSVENRGRSNHKGRSKSRNFRSKSRSGGSKGECWHCHKPGHRRDQCEAYKKHQEGSQGANVVSDEIPLECLSAGVDLLSEDWCVDSGASYHCTSMRDVFDDYVMGDFGSVIVGNGQKCAVVGKGTITLRAQSGGKLILHDARHIPNLTRNLISTSKLDEEGLTTIFGGGEWKVVTGARVIAKGKRIGTLYLLRGDSSSDIIATASAGSTPTVLWHVRLGHLSEGGVRQLHSRDLLPGLKKVEMDFCEDCVMGKQRAVSFKLKGHEKKSEKLELVHTDVWGPAQEYSYGGKRYFVTFIDDATRKTWVYAIREKSEVFTTFKNWKAMVEKETGCQVKSIKSDNGGEYTSNEFGEFLAREGIHGLKTVPRTPQENGIAERMNRTILERARCMRLHAGLPIHLWAAIVDAAVYLINRCPSSPLDGGIPEELWSGKSVNYSYLKAIGCIAYTLIDREERKKLDSKSKKCVFIGYGGDEYGYRLWDYVDNKVIRSRNVVFNEEVLYKDRHTAQEETTEVEPESVELDLGPSAGIPTVQQQVQVPQAAQEAHDEPNEEEQGDPEPVGEPELPVLRRSTRERRPKVIFDPSASVVHDYVLYTDSGEPETHEEVLKDGARNQWELAMGDEMNSLEQNSTWELAKLPAGKRALQNKWVYRLKNEPDGSMRYKARLVVKGFSQKEGVDYSEIFAPVVKMASIRILLSIVAVEDLHLEQLDVKTAFLHGVVEEELYMKQPVGFEVKGKEDMVCRLKKSLYGLKQAPRQWYLKFDCFMRGRGFERCESDHCVYIRRFDDGNTLILSLYVDDMLVASSCMKKIEEMKKMLASQFSMKDLGEAKQILGMKITRDRQNKKLWLSQEDYVKRVLKRFNMDSAKPVTSPLGAHFKLSKDLCPTTEAEMEEMAAIPYASAVGSLMYAMVCTRPDIAQAVGVVSRYMKNPGREHWNAAKWILRYLAGTSSHSLCFGNESLRIHGYADADYCGDRDESRSTTGYVLTVGGTAVSWASQLQKTVALSTTEAEYMALTEAAKDLIWTSELMSQLHRMQPIGELWSDSQSAIFLAKNSGFHARTRHIKVKYHFIRLALEEKELKLSKILGAENPADMLTKIVDSKKHQFCYTAIRLFPG